jgi:hypothetical protein
MFVVALAKPTAVVALRSEVAGQVANRGCEIDV